ncbi:MAG: DUF5020 family protein [Rickettsiales bacterium]|nr:DUF5020 family protein [Pseudomonadota bacterium]MDA0967080.1 DUF5020 family protein [Pseudomonadota bacterium]MDG4542434.1 DUF5020 family protein [Rickettsiales bacterium]MDG4544938.1 DUF5020 family protein [Rickettsiales bacterium]MDG4547061.1 DUF5020 family protein [Rickettsiales bacterium]
MRIVIPILKLLKTCTICSLICLTSNIAYADNWQSNSITFSHGGNYQLGDQDREIITFEHANGWEYGDTFFFTDISFLENSSTKVYGELHPRISLGKVLDKQLDYGIINDVLIATQLEFGSDNIRVYLYGLGTNVKIPGFSYFMLNGYVRDNENLSGSTYQISAVWDYRFPIGNRKMTINGFADWAGGEDNLEENLTIVPQFLLDIGDVWNKPNRLYGGLEYQYWHNKFGVNGIEEHAPQAIVKFIF